MPCSVPGVRDNAFIANTGPIQVHTAMQLVPVIESTFPLPNTMGISPLPQSSAPMPKLIQPQATRAKAWEAIPGVTLNWVLNIIE